MTRKQNQLGRICGLAYVLLVVGCGSGSDASVTAMNLSSGEEASFEDPEVVPPGWVVCRGECPLPPDCEVISDAETCTATPGCTTSEQSTPEEESPCEAFTPVCNEPHPSTVECKLLSEQDCLAAAPDCYPSYMDQPEPVPGEESVDPSQAGHPEFMTCLSAAAACDVRDEHPLPVEPVEGEEPIR